MLDWQHRVTYSFVKRSRTKTYSFVKDREQKQRSRDYSFGKDRDQKQRSRTEGKHIALSKAESKTLVVWSELDHTNWFELKRASNWPYPTSQQAISFISRQIYLSGIRKSAARLCFGNHSECMNLLFGMYEFVVLSEKQAVITRNILNWFSKRRKTMALHNAMASKMATRK